MPVHSSASNSRGRSRTSLNVCCGPSCGQEQSKSKGKLSPSPKPVKKKTAIKKSPNSAKKAVKPKPKPATKTVRDYYSVFTYVNLYDNIFLT